MGSYKYLKALQHKKNKEWDEYYKILINLADNYDYDLISDEIANAYDDNLELTLNYTPELITYYQNQEGVYAKKHLKELNYMYLWVEEEVFAVEYSSYNIPKAIILHKKAIKMGSKSSLNSLGYIYDMKEGYIDKNKAINLYGQSIKTIFEPKSKIENNSNKSINNLLDIFEHNVNKRKILKKFILDKYKNEYDNEIKINLLEDEIKRLKDKITHLEYMPGGIKFKKTRKRNIGKMRK